MKVHAFWFALCLCMGVSCTSKTDRMDDVRVIGIGQQMEEPVECPLRDIASSVEIVQLETSDFLLIPAIYKLHVFDKYLLVDGLLFDRSGKFLNRVYRTGEGPDEVYKGANVLQVKDGKVYTLDFAGTLKVFSLEGKRLQTIKSPSDFYFDFYPLDGSRFVGFKSNFKGTEKVCLEFFDKEGVQATVPYMEQYEPKASWYAPGEGKFFQADGGLLFKKLLCDTIYRVDGESYRMSPLYRIDFGKWASKESLRYTYNSMEELQNMLFTEMPLVAFLGQGERYLVFTTVFTDMGKQRMMYGTNLYDLRDGAACSLMLKYSDEDLKVLGEDGDPMPDFIKGASGNYFFPKAMSEDGKALVGWRQQANDRNPLVIIATLK